MLRACARRATAELPGGEGRVPAASVSGRSDAVIFLTALRHACAVVSRNVGDFDPLLRRAPEGRAVFCRRATRSQGPDR